MKLRLACATLLLAVAGVGSSWAEEGAPAAAKADPAKGAEKAGQICVACHGANGVSMIPQNPSLAGQGADYIVKQLNNFKGLPKKDQARNNPIMAAQAAMLTDDDMRNVGAYYASQKPRILAARNKDTVALGQQIYRAGIADRGIAACAGCHGATGAGLPSQYPRLGGQHAEYTEAQMKAWRSGERANDPNAMMRSVAARLTDREIAAVSDYIAGLH
jgi:cytochrome c553